jgi:ribosomal peptide maturation radical SAM protein 1
MDDLPSHAPFTGFPRLPMALEEELSGADALLIAPPFARLDLPHLGLHLLQACAQRAGFKVRVLYASMYLAREIGEPAYYAITESMTPQLLGERIFARAAYGVPLLGHQAESKLGELELTVGIGSRACTVNHDLLRRLAVHAEDWADRMARAIAALGCPIVGCSTMFEQTAASIALLRRVKQHAPETVTLLGGANCFGGMAEGVASLSPAVDYVFSSESEEAFPAFLAGARPAGRIVQGQPCMDLDALPVPDYSDYYRQQRACMNPEPADLDRLLLSFESSRGCWWGQKHHCTFCGVAVMRYRQKSPDRIIHELQTLLAAHPSRRIHATDDIMPHTYFKTLVPRLAEALPGATIFYEQKANLSLEKVVALRRAGISMVQPGIEALSSSLLKRMDKGILARQNIALLRYARVARVNLIWALLYGLPGDQREDYAHYPDLLPLLRHLEPPRTFMPVMLFRFSPYGKWPERYGVSGFRPAAVYSDILPQEAEPSRIAYVFEGEYPSISSQAPELVQSIQGEVRAWNTDWLERRSQLPELLVQPLGTGSYLLTDSRGLSGMPALQKLSRAQAAAVLTGGPLEERGVLEEEKDWARRSRYAVELDGWHVPLATAPLEVLSQFEAEFSHAGELHGAVG